MLRIEGKIQIDVTTPTSFHLLPAQRRKAQPLAILIYKELRFSKTRLALLTFYRCIDFCPQQTLFFLQHDLERHVV